MIYPLRYMTGSPLVVVLEMGELVQEVQDERGHRRYAHIVRLRIRMVEVIVRFVGCLCEARRTNLENVNFELVFHLQKEDGFFYFNFPRAVRQTT